MFAAIDAFTLDGKPIIIKVNPMHVGRFEMNDPKNVDAGTILHMTDGSEIFTPLPLDEVDLRFILVADRFAANVMIQTATYYAKEIGTETEEADPK